MYNIVMTREVLGLNHISNMFGYKARNIRNKFHNKYMINKNNCWQWMAAKRSNGTGIISVHVKNQKRTTRSAHVVAFELYYGRIPTNSIIKHTCNNNSCVNPAHLLMSMKDD